MTSFNARGAFKLPQAHNVLAADFALIRTSSDLWQGLCGKRIVVTGAAGFLASYLVEFLLSLPDAPHVIGIVRDLPRARQRFKTYATCPRLDLRAADVTDVPPVEGPIDFIFHAASQASPKYYGIDPVGTLSANIFGTQQYLELARSTGALFVFFSTGDVYGRVDRSYIGESDFGIVDPTDVRSCYGESKRMAENMCVAWNRQHGVASRIARLFHTYGPGMRADDGRVFADFVFDVVRSRPIVLKSDGTAIRSFCYLADAVNALVRIVALGENTGAYNVGNEDAESSIRDLAEMLAALYPDRVGSTTFAPRPPSSTYLQSPLNRTVPSTAKLRELGWKPQFDLATGFTRTIESYLASST